VCHVAVLAEGEEDQHIDPRRGAFVVRHVIDRPNTFSCDCGKVVSQEGSLNGVARGEETRRRREQVKSKASSDLAIWASEARNPLSFTGSQSPSPDVQVRCSIVCTYCEDQFSPSLPDAQRQPSLALDCPRTRLRHPVVHGSVSLLSLTDPCKTTTPAPPQIPDRQCRRSPHLHLHRLSLLPRRRDGTHRCQAHLLHCHPLPPPRRPPRHQRRAFHDHLVRLVQTRRKTHRFAATALKKLDGKTAKLDFSVDATEQNNWIMLRTAFKELVEQYGGGVAAARIRELDPDNGNVSAL
jgi:hypothetical protein